MTSPLGSSVAVSLIMSYALNKCPALRSGGQTVASGILGCGISAWMSVMFILHRYSVSGSQVIEHSLYSIKSVALICRVSLYVTSWSMLGSLLKSGGRLAIITRFRRASDATGFVSPSSPTPTSLTANVV
jgi:hypothetical protein